jgi:hypothetical protein
MRALALSLLHLVFSLPIHLVENDKKLLNGLGWLPLEFFQGPAELLA